MSREFLKLIGSGLLLLALVWAFLAAAFLFGQAL